MASHECSEQKMLGDVLKYLSNGEYPPDANKSQKAVIRRKAKDFQVIEGRLC